MYPSNSLSLSLFHPKRIIAEQPIFLVDISVFIIKLSWTCTCCKSTAIYTRPDWFHARSGRFVIFSRPYDFYSYFACYKKFALSRSASAKPNRVVIAVIAEFHKKFGLGFSTSLLTKMADIK